MSKQTIKLIIIGLTAFTIQIVCYALDSEHGLTITLLLLCGWWLNLIIRINE